MIVLLLVVETTSCYFPQWLHQFTSPRTVSEYFFFHILANIYLCFFLTIIILTGLRQCLIVVLNCVSTMINDAERLLICLMYIYISSLETCLFSSSVHFGASLVAQLVKNTPQCKRPGFDLWVRKILWRTETLPTPVFLGFPAAQVVKNLPSIWDTRFDPWVGKIPWRRERLPTPVFWPGELHRLYSPWGCKESYTPIFNAVVCLSFFKCWVGLELFVYVGY